MHHRYSKRGFYRITLISAASKLQFERAAKL